MSGIRDIKSLLKMLETLAPASRTAAVNGSGVDCRGYDSAMVEIHFGAFGGTTPSFTFEIQESEDNSVFTAVAAADLDAGQPGAFTAIPTPSVQRYGYKGTKRYIRAAITAATGTSPTLLCSAAVVLGASAIEPVI